MAYHNNFGKMGEKIACDFLKSKGYIIREQNWTSGKLEVDLIAEKKGTIVFVEVKSRQKEDQEVSEIISPAKEKNLINAAGLYMEQIDEKYECRIDVIIVHTKTGTPEVIHIEDAITQA